MLKPDTTSPLKLVKYTAIALSSLMVAGIVALMVLARGTGEDITGIVSPAALLAIISGAVALAAFISEKCEQRSAHKKSNDDRTS